MASLRGAANFISVKESFECEKSMKLKANEASLGEGIRLVSDAGLISCLVCRSSNIVCAAESAESEMCC